MLALGLSLAGVAVVTTPASSSMCADSAQALDAMRETAVTQAILEENGYLAPGDYRKGESDASTRAALRTFQARHGLAPTGAMDHDTMTQLSSHRETTDRDDTVALVLKGVRFEPDTAHLTLGSRDAGPPGEVSRLVA
jgi:murein L,D-transpeptidase YcbB/YkuD